jgi:hypothetical protein
MFLDHFDVLMSKIIFFLKKNIILMYFEIKSILKNNRGYNPKYPWISRLHLSSSLCTCTVSLVKSENSCRFFFFFLNN